MRAKDWLRRGNLGFGGGVCLFPSPLVGEGQGGGATTHGMGGLAPHGGEHRLDGPVSPTPTQPSPIEGEGFIGQRGTGPLLVVCALAHAEAAPARSPTRPPTASYDMSGRVGERAGTDSAKANKPLTRA
jgi:hypothetical protein